MNENKQYRHLLHTLQIVDNKCNRILDKLDRIGEIGEDKLISTMRSSARQLYETSLKERDKLGVTMRIFRHGR